MLVAIAVLPAFLFLAALLLMDSFKLVRPASVGLALAYGMASALLCAAIHERLLGFAAIDLQVLTRYIAPLTEEAAKALFVAYLISRRRVGFVVDAAVQGFAVGTGFAIVENVAYIRELGQAPLVLWVVRGLGTAILHGATTAVVAMVAKTIADRRPDRGALAVLPGWALGAVVHSAYNHLLVSPLVATALLLIVLPLLVLAVFERSDRATREWVGAGLDLDLELLHLVVSEHFQVTRFGIYLRELRTHFDGPIVADMFCLLRLELELSVQAKARLIAREAGLEVPVDDDLHEALSELEYLRKSIGPTGLLALKPLQVTSHRDDWHRFLLSQADVRARIKDRLRSPRRVS
jgi:RsiW-degrading membrane proteinase PrsW (M82 family)